MWTLRILEKLSEISFCFHKMDMRRVRVMFKNCWVFQHSIWQPTVVRISQWYRVGASMMLKVEQLTLRTEWNWGARQSVTWTTWCFVWGQHCFVDTIKVKHGCMTESSKHRVAQHMTDNIQHFYMTEGDVMWLLSIRAHNMAIDWGPNPSVVQCWCAFSNDTLIVDNEECGWECPTEIICNSYL